MVTKFLDNKKIDFWQNGKTWRNMMEKQKNNIEKWKITRMTSEK